MKQLFFIRHGETHHNVQQIFSGQIEAELTEKGHQQAKQAASQAKLTLPHVDLMIVSPYKRARDTARYIADAIDYDKDAIEYNDLFIERGYGLLEDVQGLEIMDLRKHNVIDQIEGVETLEQLRKRAKKAYAYLISRNDADVILVVGHGAFARALIRVIQDLPTSHEYESYYAIGNAEIVQLI